jgi:dinuclear metal center YbgI/SA1388 family protein
MAHISDILAALDELLEPSKYRDLCPNGLQVPGTQEISRVITAVSAQRELSVHAVEMEAQLALVHHGLFWDFQPPGLSPVQAERLRPLFKHDINLAAYHIPLDAHPTHGNNALLADALGCDAHEPFGDYHGTPIGRRGSFGNGGITLPELRDRVRAATRREPTIQGAGAERIRAIGIVSGSAADMLAQAVDAGLDAFLTGEPREHVMADARESGIHFIAAGHYATETFGVRALGDMLEERFSVEHIFVDIPNPV